MEEVDYTNLYAIISIFGLVVAVIFWVAKLHSNVSYNTKEIDENGKRDRHTEENLNKLKEAHNDLNSRVNVNQERLNGVENEIKQQISNLDRKIDDKFKATNQLIETLIKQK